MFKRKKIQLQDFKTKKIFLVDEEDAQDFIDDYPYPERIIAVIPESVK